MMDRRDLDLNTPDGDPLAHLPIKLASARFTLVNVQRRLCETPHDQALLIRECQFKCIVTWFRAWLLDRLCPTCAAGKWN
jgi:hypothetical protein